MMDDDWPFGVGGVTKGVFWAIGFLKLFFFHNFCMCVFYHLLAKNHPKKTLVGSQKQPKHLHNDIINEDHNPINEIEFIIYIYIYITR
jgi:hypothetical protein